MIELSRKVLEDPKYARAFQWGKLISITGSAQIIIQAVGFASGILIIRYLPTKEYALYTLSNTMLGTMVILSDGGISTGVMAQGGVVWQDKKKLGAVLSTALNLRKRFSLGSLGVSMPILFYLLVHNGASLVTSFLIVISLIPAFYSSLSDSLLEIPLKLNQVILPLQKNQVYVGIGRLLLSVITIFIFPFTFVAILVSGIPRILGNISLRKMTNKLVILSPLPDREIKSNILKIVKRSMPSSIYYCLSGQITIWIISLFGNVNSIAEIGAMSRLVMPMTLISGLVGILIVPRYAIIKNGQPILFTFFSKIISGIFLLSFFILGIAYLFSTEILWILGKNYRGLEMQFFLVIIAGCINLITGIVYSLNSCRGWIIKPFLSISISILPIVLGCYFFDISKLTGVLYMNIFSGLTVMSLNILYALYKILSLERAEMISEPFEEVIS